MTTFQKVIKYGAIAFGIFLTVNIISAIIMGFTVLFGITTGLEGIQNTTTSEVMQISEDLTLKESEIQNIKIDIANAKLTIKEGENLKVEARDVSNNFRYTVNGSTLKIEDEHMGFWGIQWGNNLSKANIILYLPSKMELKDVKIDTGINEMVIENLTATDIKINCGVGTLTINKMNAERLDIDAGAGKTEITNCIVNDLDLDTGAGKVEFTGDIIRKSRYRLWSRKNRYKFKKSFE